MNEEVQAAPLPERTIETITGEIKALRTQTLACVIEIGRRLKEAKAMLPHGEFGTWLEKEVEFSQSTANNFMKLFDAYGSAQSCLFGAEVNSQAIGNLSVTNALRLLAIPEDEREAFAAEHDVEHLSSREMDKLIKERDALQRKFDEANADAALTLDETKKKAICARADADAAAERAEALKKELDELKSRPVEVAVQQPDPEEQQAAIEEAVAEKTKELTAALKKAKKEKAEADKLNADVEREKAAAEKKAEQAAAEKADAEAARDEAQKELEKAAKADAMNDAAVQQFKSLFETAQGILSKLDTLAKQAENEGKPQLRQALQAVCGQYVGGSEQR